MPVRGSARRASCAMCFAPIGIHGLEMTRDRSQMTTLEAPVDYIDSWTTRLLVRLASLPHSLGLLASTAGLFLVYLPIAYLSRTFVISPHPSAIFWLPSGLTIALFIRARWFPSLWLGWLLAIGLAQYVTFLDYPIPVPVKLFMCTANMLPPLTAGLVARRFSDHVFGFRRVRDTLLFGALTIVSVLPGALVSAASVAFFLGADSFGRMAASWAISDALGIILLAPVILTWTTRYRRPVGGAIEAFFLFVGMIGVSVVAFFRPARSFLGPPLLSLFIAWASIRLGPRATTLAVFLIDGLLVAATMRGTGPLAIAGLDPGVQLFMLQISAGAGAMLMLLLASAIEDQRRALTSAKSAHRRAQRSETQLRRANEELEALTQQLHSSKEEERRNIAQEMHDGLGQVLTAAKVQLHLAGRHQAAATIRAEMDQVQTLIDQCLDGVRNLSRGMKPALLDEVGLVPALEVFLDEQRRHAGPVPTLRAPVQLPRLSSTVEVALFRIIQEAYTNALRHARAQNVLVALDMTIGNLAVTVRDDGQGFDVDAVIGRTMAAQHLGLVGMRERARAIGGSFAITSHLDQGTQVRVTVPLRRSLP